MSDPLNDWINAAASDCVNAHVRPEPAPAPEPQPLTYAQHKARVAAWQHLVYRGGVVVSFPLLCEAMDAADEMMRQAHKSALGRVL